ncbi:uncharacterized protein LOC143150992 [Ptiloglossa arizonensis]|uniref:uncharacterized protein LOC143150992 n=1 Tax=Ptiloglossa arizonensis TaxID=3350558 RepID=UPI003FA096B1
MRVENSIGRLMAWDPWALALNTDPRGTSRGAKRPSVLLRGTMLLGVRFLFLSPIFWISVRDTRVLRSLRNDGEVPARYIHTTATKHAERRVAIVRDRVNIEARSFLTNSNVSPSTALKDKFDNYRLEDRSSGALIPRESSITLFGNKVHPLRLSVFGRYTAPGTDVSNALCDCVNAFFGECVRGDATTPTPVHRCER